MSIAVTGATGQLGQLVIQELLNRTTASNIVALVRHPEKAKHLTDLGIMVKTFNYTAEQNQLVEALDDVDKLLLISSSEVGQRLTQHENVLNAAKTAGVKFIAYTSILNAENSPLALAAEHIATENFIKTLNLPYTLLRNNWYSENYTGTLAQAIEHGAILGATHHAKISSASRLDYATAAAVVLTSSGHDNKIYELAGDESYTLDQLAQLTSDLSGKNVVYKDLSEDEYAQTLVQVGVPEVFAKILADSDEGASKGGLYSESKDLQQLIGRKTTSIQETIQTALNTK